MTASHNPAAFHKAELFRASDHSEIAGPGLCVKLPHAIQKVIVNKGTQGIRADAIAPYIRFTNINANGTVYRLSFLNLTEPLKLLVNGIGAYPANMPAIAFNFKLPPAQAVRKVFYRFIVF